MAKLIESRKKKGMKRKELAVKSGVSERLIRAYENETRDINKGQAITLYRLAKVLGCRIEDLMDLSIERDEVGKDEIVKILKNK